MVYRRNFLSRGLFHTFICRRGWRVKARRDVIMALCQCFHHNSSTCFSAFDEKAIRAKFLKSQGKHGEVLLKKLDNEKKGISVIKISNPDRRNAITGAMMVELAEIVDELETWNDGKAVILHGSHGTFCSGADLTFAKAIQTPEEGGEMSSLMHLTLKRLRRLPMISVAAIEGRALGGGAEIPLACDFRLMSESAEMRFVQAKMGVSPGWGGGVKLVQLVGRRKALELLLQAKRVKLADALKWGLVDGKLEDGVDVIESCCKWLEDYLQVDTTVLRAMKSVVAASDDNLLDKALEIERSIFTTLWGADENKEALNQQKKHR